MGRNFRDMVYPGLYAVLLIFLPHSYHLSVYEAARLVLLAAALLWLAYGRDGRGGLALVSAPLVLVFCAVQFDPQALGQSGAEDPWPAGLYRFLLIFLAAVLAVFLVLGRRGEAMPHPALGRFDKWVLWTGIFAVAFYAAAGLFSAEVSLEKTLVVGLLFLSYIILYLSARRALSEPGRSRRFTVSLAVLAAAAAIVVAVKLSFAFYLYKNGESLLKGRDYRGGIAVLKMAERMGDTLSVKPLGVKIHYGLAEAYGHTKEVEEALREIREVLAIDKDYLPALKLAGKHHLSRRDWKNAAGSFEKAYNLDKADTSYFPGMALAYAHLGYVEKGRFLSQYQGDLSRSVRGWYNKLILSWALNKWGRYSEARKLAEDAVQRVDPSMRYLAYTELGISLEGLGMAREAKSSYAKAVKLDPEKSVVARACLERLNSAAGADETGRAGQRGRQ